MGIPQFSVVTNIQADVTAITANKKLGWWNECGKESRARGKFISPAPKLLVSFLIADEYSFRLLYSENVVRNVIQAFENLFGCWHRHLTFPLTARRGTPRPIAARETGTYIVCLDCGKEFAYDWQQMHVVREPNTQARAIRSLVENIHQLLSGPTSHPNRVPKVAEAIVPRHQ